ncbi:HAD family hydrolase [Paenibacillus daejeonensis]|uniref:HAD family hydrolase n=1 Tax=Paenibacillus daejeonensis TaxID=135193 RepID=UPI00036CA370|nr:HAD family hydrolase [Paenibacillus daejeonensis]
MSNLQAILFDLDNTLLDRTQTFQAFTDLFASTYFAHLSSTTELCELIIERDQDGYKDKHQLFNELLEELPWRERPTASELMDFYMAEYVNNAVLMEQAKETLALVREAGYLTGLITNGRNEVQYGKIDRLGIRDAFDVILVSEEAGIKKPDPAIFKMAVERLGVDTQACLFIGDHPINDIEAAAKLGMKTIWIQVNQPWQEELATTPTHSIKHLGELRDLFSTL